MTVREGSNPTRGRMAAFDGLRGIAIALVVLSHGWTLWPIDGIPAAPVIGGAFSSGNFAVTIFFTVGAYFLTTSLLGEGAEARWTMIPRAVWRRFVRLSAQVYPLVLVVLVSRALDPKDRHPWDDTRQSLLSVMTYTWNWYVQNNGPHARPDLGHLWYLSVDLQWCIALAVVVFVLRRRRTALVAVLGLLLVAVTVWRMHVLGTEGWYTTGVRSTTRADGILCGALIAATAPAWRRWRGGTIVTTVGATGILALIATMPQAGDNSWLQGRGVWFDVAATCTVLGLLMEVNQGERSRVARALAWRPLTWLGAMSLAVYVWHFPIFWSVSQHTFGWAWVPKAALAFSLVLGVSIATTKYLERPVNARLASRRGNRPAGAPADAAAATSDVVAADRPA